MDNFDGLGLGLHNIWRLSNAKTRSISAENPTGEPGMGGMAVPPVDERGKPKGSAREMGQGWKVRPCIQITARRGDVPRPSL